MRIRAGGAFRQTESTRNDRFPDAAMMTSSQAFPRLRQATQADWKIRIVGAGGGSDSRYEATLARLKSRSLEELEERKQFGNDEQLTVFLRGLRSDRPRTWRR